MREQIEQETKYAKCIIDKEINGLTLLRDSIADNFSLAVDLLYKKKGHIIISGIGKPGHIAKKISATLASTGTPSFFLHPAEASHGDLGMISSNDALVILSLSGNTQELLSLIAYANRFAIDIIGVTANPDSILVKASAVKILLPKIDEACPHNLAPTTSTTMMIAIGDALALCLLKRKEFNREDFKKLHPGGALGKRLLTVKDLMHTTIPNVDKNHKMEEVLIEMTQKSFGCVCILDNNNKILGIITDGDLRRHMSLNLLSLCAKDVMTCNPKVINQNAFAQEAIKIMNAKKITSLFVTDDRSKVVGILHIHDCLRAGLA